MENQPRKPYPSDVSDDEWAFVAPYLTLMRPDAPQRVHDPREVYDALRWMVRTGAQWRMLPNDLPPWEAVYQQARRWLDADGQERLTHELLDLMARVNRSGDGDFVGPSEYLEVVAVRR